MPLVPMHIFCVPLGKPSKISTKPLKKAYFATCLAFWPDFVLKTNKTVRKSRQVEEKPTFFFFSSARPRGNAAAATARPPGTPRATPAPSLPGGRATPGSAHAKCGPTPGCRGDARGLPHHLPPPWGRCCAPHMHYAGCTTAPGRGEVGLMRLMLLLCCSNPLALALLLMGVG